MHAILQHCYFRAPLFHYKTSIVCDSSIDSTESLSDKAVYMLDIYDFLRSEKEY